MFDEQHACTHGEAEADIRAAINRFPANERPCRVTSLLAVVAEELLAMDNVTDIDDVLKAFFALINLRVEMCQDLLQTEGSA